MRHTFIFMEGLWSASGEYTDKDGTYELEGSARISHSDEVWVNEGYLKLVSSRKTLELRNGCEIMPPEEGDSYASWRSFNPAIGVSYGKFVVVGDTILSTFSSEDKKYTGCESLIKVSDNVYRTRGFLLKGKERVASWVAELTRVDGMLH